MAQPAPAPAPVNLRRPFFYIDGTGDVYDPYHTHQGQYNTMPPRRHSPYDMNSKIMLAAIISLSLVIALAILLHLYARYVLRRRYRHTVFTTDGGVTTIPRIKTGLDPAVIASLPISAYRSSTDAVECAVCLSLLEEDEMVRSLPNCGHGFHAECVDKWLSCHTTCPICRTEAQPPPVLINIEPEPDEKVVSVATAPAASTSRMGSFKRMLSRERSSRRMQIEIREVQGDEDLERR
ncbi:E3 ubiquitin-protein ligase ATL41 [Linum grandiflorum]